MTLNGRLTLSSLTQPPKFLAVKLYISHMCYPTQRDQVTFGDISSIFIMLIEAHVQKYLNLIQISHELLDKDQHLGVTPKHQKYFFHDFHHF